MLESQMNRRFEVLDFEDDDPTKKEHKLIDMIQVV